MDSRIFQQSAVIPVWQSRVVLITSRNAGKWIVPKGLIEPHLTPRESAAQEALEEAGIIGHVRPDPVGSYEYEKWGGLCRVQVYTMEVLKLLTEWQEMYDRVRRIVPPQTALQLIEQSELRSIVASVFADDTSG